MKIKGSKDLKPRKKKRFYAGKPIKKKRKNRGGNFVPYVSKRKKNDPIRIWFQEKKKMSPEGYRRWNRKARKYLDPTIKVFIGKPVLVDPQEISTPERIGETAIEILGYDGLFNMLMPSASRSSFRVSYKKKAVVKIIDTENGFRAIVTNFAPLRKYKWFWKG